MSTVKLIEWEENRLFTKLVKLKLFKWEFVLPF